MDIDALAKSLEESLKRVNVTSKVNILCTDPLVYEVPKLLSDAECLAYQNHINAEGSRRTLTRSNPPDVSLDISKLWPLPFLALVAGLPPYFRLLRQDSGSDGNNLISRLEIAQTVLPNVVIALSCMAALAWGVVLPLVRQQSNAASRTSVAAALNHERDVDFVRPLVERVTAAVPMGHPWQCWEAPVVTRYEPGAIFARHSDASSTQGSEWNDTGGQRVVTCICYLNTVSTGGETYFDKLNLAVQPATGKALIFFPADRETWKADDRTTHESLPPTSDKWIVQMFGRVERVPSPLGLPDSFASSRI